MQLVGNIRLAKASLVLFVLFVGASYVPPLAARSAIEPPERAQGPFVSPPVTPQLSPAARSLPEAAPWKPGDPVREAPSIRKNVPGVEESTGEQTSDPFVQRGARAAARRTPDPTLNFDGIGYTGSVPPDTIGDVGPNHYVQAVNASFAIYDKSGAQLKAPTNINQLWASANAGNRCKARNDGDPVVLYDPLADRWLISQFVAFSPYAVCVAVSQTPDPAGAYYLYEFAVDVFPDYLKFGVWPDAYYMSSNDEAPVGGGTGKDGIYAFDRAKMLTGQAATYQKFQVQRNFMLPSDVDGSTPPPAGAPNYFYTIMDDTFWPSQGIPGVDRLEVWEFHADWTTPANSTFAKTQDLPTPFNYLLCGFFVFNCVPQPAPGQKVDAIAEYPMWRFAYRNFGTHQALVGNFTVKVTDPDHAGIRWFELRKTGSGGWSIYQQGTFSPDNNYRWMGSAAMDRSGNIAVGYSVSSSALNPTIRYATRLYTDTLGTLQDEATLQPGGGVQTSGSNRWGDYSAMSVDPGDDCTFWYTSEYYASTSSRTWSTRIGTFKLPSCGVSQLALRKTVSNPNPLPGEVITYTIAVSNSTLIAAPSSIVSDTLPTGLTFAGPVTITPPDAGTVGTSPSLIGLLNIASSQVVTMTVPVTVNVGLPAGTVITNTATITSTSTAGPASAATSLTVANAVPMLANDTSTTKQDTPVTINALANDSDLNGDNLTITAVSVPPHGTAATNGATITYTPAPGYFGPDAFTYSVSDGQVSVTAAVTISVTQAIHAIYLPLMRR